MQVRLVRDGELTAYGADDVPELLVQAAACENTFVWVDIALPDPEAEHMLARVLSCHPKAVEDCLRRNLMPRIHIYPGETFIIMQAPELGEHGHVHYIEFDQFIGADYLVTAHGPLNPAVDPAVGTRDAEAVLRRMLAGKHRPHTPHELAYAITATIARAQEAFIERLSADVWRLEQTVLAGHHSDPEQVLDDLHRTRHGLLAVQTMADMAVDCFGRILAVGSSGNPASARLDRDLVDQFQRVTHLAGSQVRYLDGTIGFYATRTETKMMIASERLSLIAVLTLPITALSSIVGMNVIVSDETQPWALGILLAIMVIGSVVVLSKARREGWW